MEKQLNDITVSVLPDDCLRDTFLCLPIIQRIQLREVCKRWRKISDDCWRHIRVIVLLSPISLQGCNQAEDCGRTIKIRTRNVKFAKGFVKRSAKFLTTIKDRRATQTFSILPAMKLCDKIDKLEIRLNSKRDNNELHNLFTVNRQIRCIQIIIVTTSNHTYDCLDRLRANCLEELSILIEGLQSRSKILFDSIRHLIENCRALKELTIEVERDEMLEAVGDRVNLEHLDVRIFHGSVGGLQNIVKLCNLRSLQIHHFDFKRPLITDKLLENLSKNCVQLESVSLSHCSEVTDRALLALSRLSKLKVLKMISAPKITNKYLVHFSNIEKLGIYDSSISDPGVIALLRNSPRLNYLKLYNSKMTIASIRAAAEETRKREHGAPLKVVLSDMNMDLSELGELPPLLHFIYND